MFRRKTLLISIVALSLFFQIIAPATKVFAASDAPVMQLHIQSRAASYYYYYALKACIHNHSDDLSSSKGLILIRSYISDADAKAGNWWATGGVDKSAVAGTYIDKSMPVSGLNGSTLCNTVVKKAASLWKTTPIDLLCGMTTGSGRYVGIYRDNNQDCKTGSNDFIGRFDDANMTMLLNFIKKQIYTESSGKVLGIDTAMGPQAGQYFMWYAALTSGCGYKINDSAGGGSNIATGVPIVNVETGAIENHKMVGSKSLSEKINVYSDGNSSEITRTCQQVVDAMKGLANGASTFIKNEKASGGSPAGTGTKDCSEDPGSGNCETSGESSEDEERCKIDYVGWILCPVVEILANTADSAQEQLSKFLEIKSDITLDRSDGSAFSYWSSIRDYANVAFVLVFLFVIYSQLTGFGLDNYGIKRMLPKMVVGVILVNISFYICALLVDLSNLVGANAFTFISQVNLEGGPSGNWSNQGNWVTTVAAGAMAVVAGYFALASVISALIFIVFIAVATVFLLGVRQAIVILAIVLSPLAFVARLLPNTEGLFKKWWSMFKAMLLLYPVVGIVYGASNLAAGILSNSASGDDFILQLIAAVLLFAPLILVPKLVNSAMNIAGIANMVGNLRGRADRFTSSKARDRINSGTYGKIRQYQQQQKQIRQARARAGEASNRFRGGVKNPLNWGNAANARLHRAANAGMQGVGLGKVAEDYRLRATEIASKEFRDQVALVNAGFEDQSFGEINDMALGRVKSADGSYIKSPDKYTEAQRQAAIEYIMEKGNFSQRRALIEQSGEMTQRQRAAISDRMAAKGDQSVYGAAMIDKVKTGQVNGANDVEQSVAQTIADGKIKGKSMAHDADAAKLIADVSTSGKKYDISYTDADGNKKTVSRAINKNEVESVKTAIREAESSPALRSDINDAFRKQFSRINDFSGNEDS